MKSIQNEKIKLLRLYLIFFALLSVLLLRQTMGGKYEEILFIVWLWLLLLYIPPILTLFQIKNNDNILFYKELKFISIVFSILTTLLFFLFLPLAFKSESVTPLSIIVISSLILFPMEFYFIFKLKKKMIFPNKELLNSEFIFEKPKVFISYNHQDFETANNIKYALENKKIDVIIDKVDMKPGSDIKEFIEKSVLESNIIISIVSNASLKSAWVAMETINTFNKGGFYKNKKLIACYLDDDFFQLDYTLKTINVIDDQIKINQELIAKYHKKMMDTRDLNNQNTRLLALRNNLDEIIRKLRESLCLDVREGNFENSIKQLIKSIKV